MKKINTKKSQFPIFDSVIFKDMILITGGGGG